MEKTESWDADNSIGCIALIIKSEGFNIKKRDVEVSLFHLTSKFLTRITKLSAPHAFY